MSARIAAIALLLLGCATPRVDAGIIIGKWVVPAHTETYQSGTVCRAYDRAGVCSLVTPTYWTNAVPDVCWLRLQADEQAATHVDVAVACGDRFKAALLGQFVRIDDMSTISADERTE